MKRHMVPLASFVAGGVVALVAVAVVRSPGMDIHTAVRRNDPAAIRKCIAAGADPCVANVLGLTPMHFAAGYGFIECAQALIEGGARVNPVDTHGATPLHHVCAELQMPKSTKEEMIEFLLASGAEINAANTRGDSPLHEACRLSGAGVAILLEAGADVNARNALGQPPLFQAAQQASVGVVELLVAHGASLTIEDNDGRTVLDFARAHKRERLLELMAQQATEEE